VTRLAGDVRQGAIANFEGDWGVVGRRVILDATTSGITFDSWHGPTVGTPAQDAESSALSP
jgi:hypothetical protein